MSYNLSLACGCLVYVSCHPRTRLAHTRVIQRRGSDCQIRRHEVGLHLYLWEILPDPHHQSRLEWADAFDDVTWPGDGDRRSAFGEKRTDRR
jgi:hypothetical protein